MIRAEVKYGNDYRGDDDGWRASSNPWTVTLKNGRRRMTVPYWTGSAITDEPTAADVLESLLLDASVGDQSFHDFCADLGYDEDSRKAERLHRECQRIAERLARFLGADYYTLRDQSRDEWTVEVDA